MHVDSTFRMRGAFAALASAVVLAAASFPALAQSGGPTGPPGIDHYLVYRANPIAGSYPIALRDQFSPVPTTHVADPLEFFANPVSKNNEGIFEPILHYTWWHINPPRPYSGAIVASNQFGDQTLTLGPAEYLWNPALKNIQIPPVPPLPVANHYLCYRATGQFIPRTVSLQDQFGVYQATVLFPEWFCNPVDKQFQGNVEPIVRPDAHQTCYRIQPVTPFPPTTITWLDEFLFGQTVLTEQIWLCVPTFKHEVVGAEPSSWGAVKSTYR
jgi:hypothetical protein